MMLGIGGDVQEDPVAYLTTSSGFVHADSSFLNTNFGLTAVAQAESRVFKEAYPGIQHDLGLTTLGEVVVFPLGGAADAFGFLGDGGTFAGGLTPAVVPVAGTMVGITTKAMEETACAWTMNGEGFLLGRQRARAGGGELRERPDRAAEQRLLRCEEDGDERGHDVRGEAGGRGRVLLGRERARRAGERRAER